MKQRFLNMCVCMILGSFLWMSGIFAGENIWMNSVNMAIYGKKSIITLEQIGQIISDGVIGCISPLWLIKKEEIHLFYRDCCELYPSVSVMEALYKENHPEGNVQDVYQPLTTTQNRFYSDVMLSDPEFFLNEFYLVDQTTYADGLLDGLAFKEQDLTIDLFGSEPKILIYHTHSQEAFSDSRPGMWEDTVVGLGDVLKKHLEERYHISVIHLKDSFDVIDGVTDRSEAYTYAEEKVRKVLEEYPSIEVVIDLHRDGVAESTHLVTEVNGLPTAQLMFLNGLCRTVTNGPIAYLKNENLSDNLAFSFQMQLKAAEYYPNLMRRIYLRSYQYNLHILPRSLLIECGAQTNTVEEVKNAMLPLADLLYMVLSGS